MQAGLEKLLKFREGLIQIGSKLKLGSLFDRYLTETSQFFEVYQIKIFKYLEKKLDLKYTCEELLDTLKAMNFAEIQEQGFIPLYRKESITDVFHEAYSFRTDYQFITKSKMRTIQKKSKGKE